MIEALLTQAKNSCRIFQNTSKKDKILALEKIEKSLISHTEEIIKENAIDIENAKKSNMPTSMIDRLTLTKERIYDMAKGVEKIKELNDPIGEIVREIQRPNGLKIQQIRIPLGVIGIVYEARPNVTVDIASICIKTNNVCVLKGGKEAFNTNKKLVEIMHNAIQDIFDVNPIYLIENMDRKVVLELISDRKHVDVVIPRGGKGLIQTVVQNAKVPVIETGAGICHLYIDKDASMDMAINIAINAKAQRPSVCNSIETILVHKDIARPFLTKLKEHLKNVKYFADEKSKKYIDADLATHSNYETEYNDLICNIKTVKSINEAIEHIYTYSTKHSESIITDNLDRAKYFIDSLDSACVYHNASTRFTDGGEFGFGAEVGISTQKLHARGPLGLQEMTSTKYVIYGNGQIRK